MAIKLHNSHLWSIVDVNSGEVILEDEFRHRPSSIINGFFYVQDDEGNFNFYNLKDVRKPINKEPYKEVTDFSYDGHALAVKKGGGILLLDKECNVVKELGKDIMECSSFSEEGTATFKDDGGKFGIINTKGDVIVKAQYDYAGNYTKDGVAIVGKRDSEELVNYKALDKEGNVLFSFTSHDYDHFGDFSDGYMPVTVKEGSYYDVYFLDKSGKRTKKFGKSDGFNLPRYAMHDGVTVYMEGHSYGLKNSEGDVLLRPKYDDLFFMKDKKYIARKDGNWGIINDEDEIVLPFEYKELMYLKDNRVLVGSEHPYSIIDLEQKDITNEDFTDFSLVSSTSVRSNYFDVRKVAQKYLDVLQDDSFYGISQSYTLRNFEYLLTGSASSYAYVYHLTETNRNKGVDFTYYFRNGLIMDEYEEFFGERYVSGKKFNYSSPITAVTASFSLRDYSETAEEAFKGEFEKSLRNKGFSPNSEGYYENIYGHSVGVSYRDGIVSIRYYFTNLNLEELVTIPREEYVLPSYSASDEDDRFDYNEMDSAVVDDAGSFSDY